MYWLILFGFWLVTVIDIVSYTRVKRRQRDLEQTIRSLESAVDALQRWELSRQRPNNENGGQYMAVEIANNLYEESKGRHSK